MTKVHRLGYLDFLSAIFILQMILGHILTLYKIKSEICEEVFLYSSFYVAFFFFKSGMFYQSKESFFSYYRLNMKRLLIPFVVFSIIGYLIAIPIELYTSTLPLYKTILYPFKVFLTTGGGSNMPLWFLLSLFYARIVFDFLYKRHLMWIVIIFPAVGYLLDKFDCELFLGLNTIFLSVCFYYAGYIYKNKLLNSKICFFLCFVTFFFFVLFRGPSAVDFRVNNLFYGTYWGFIIYSIAGIITCIEIARNLHLCDIIKIGNDSMIFLAIHWPIILLVRLLFNNGIDSAIIRIGVCYISIYIIYWLFQPLLKRYPWIVGKS